MEMKSGCWIAIAVLALLSCRHADDTAKPAAQAGTMAPAQPRRYLSDSDPTYAVLEGFQKREYGRETTRRSRVISQEQLVQMEELMRTSSGGPDSPAAGSVDGSRAEYEAFRRETHGQHIREVRELVLPTRYENPLWYLHVQTLTQRIESTLQATGNAPRHRVIFGTSPTRTVGAQVLAVPGSSDHVAIFHEDLFHATYLLMKVLVQTLDWRETRTSYERDRIKERVKDPDVQRRFREAMAWYAKPAGSPSFYVLEPNQTRLANVLTRGMELFVIAHEYAHVLLGHTRRGDSVADQLWSWRQEIAADSLACEIVLATAQHSGSDFENGFALWGPELMLAGLDILERVDAFTRTGTAPVALSADPARMETVGRALKCLEDMESPECVSLDQRASIGTHPPLALRRALVRETMRRFPRNAAVMKDEWDFGQALIVAGYALLHDTYGPIAAGLPPGPPPADDLRGRH